MRILLIFFLLLSSQSFAVDFVSEKKALKLLQDAPKTLDLQGAREAQALALDILKKTIEQNTWSAGFIADNAIFKRLHSRLAKANMIIELPHDKLRFCDENTMAYAFGHIGNNVYLCLRALKQPIEIVAQIIIHESAHFVVGTNECRATNLEVLAMMNSDLPYAIKNGYWDRCKILRFQQRVSRYMSEK
ncbi:hypothetical protein [Bacteriovorax sp. BSW11_IV]|uniref:hypothetical protein n=1 Tax=Bacteriovorax sp. BSW11_IV TaxID=1353529 RepID=UPI000417B34A|nr:hypothetical protein [Bacteriovorax sp. BSW11_IV]